MMRKWLMPVLAMSFMAACGAQQEEAADQSTHSVVVVRLPENAAEDDMSKAEVRAFSDTKAFASSESVAAAFGSGEAVTFNALASDEDVSESSTESGRYNNYNNYNRYGSNYGYGNSYGNYRWNYNRNRDCFSTGSNYYYRNKRHNYGGFNYFMFFR